MQSLCHCEISEASVKCRAGRSPSCSSFRAPGKRRAQKPGKPSMRLPAIARPRQREHAHHAWRGARESPAEQPGPAWERGPERRKKAAKNTGERIWSFVRIGSNALGSPGHARGWPGFTCPQKLSERLRKRSASPGASLQWSRGGLHSLSARIVMPPVASDWGVTGPGSSVDGPALRPAAVKAPISHPFAELKGVSQNTLQIEHTQSAGTARSSFRTPLILLALGCVQP